MDEQELKNLLEEGLSLRQLAEQTNKSQTSIRHWIKKFGLKLKRGPKGLKPKDFCFPRKCACGETDPKKFYGHKTTVCAKCHSKYTLEKGHENRLYMLEKLGSKCSNANCGFDKYKSSLDVHHIDPAEKDPAFSTIRYWTKEKIDVELKKCVLLCKNCHAAYHAGELVLEIHSGIAQR